MNGAWLFAALTAGCLAGLVHFGALWLTVDGLQRTRHPGLRMLASMLGRTLIACSILAVAAVYGDWRHLALATLGFFLLRTWALHRARARPPRKEPGT